MGSSPYADGIQPVAPLVIMVGAPGAGKSTWAAARFPHDQMFGLDMFRRLLAGNVLDQDATAAAAEMLDVVRGYRMAKALTTVIDATNVNWERRDGMRWHAQQNRRPAVAVMMHTPLAVCLARNAGRRHGLAGRPWPGANDRPVDDTTVIERMHAAALSDPPSPDDFDLVVHVHPDDPDVAYALPPGRGHSIRWAGELLHGDEWGKGITLITGSGAQLPWTTPVNASIGRG